MTIHRRKFLKLGCCGMAFGFASTFTKMGLVNAMAQTSSDYKALVCVFLFGGNDANNLLVPNDTPGYGSYSSARAVLALPRNTLLPIMAGSTPYGLHPSVPELQRLFNQGNLAFLANVGTLVRPVTRSQILQGTAVVPQNLFSHADQQEQLQTSQLLGAGETGWGGRIADKVQPLNSGALFPSLISTAGSNIFVDAAQAKTAAVNVGQINNLNGFSQSADDNARYSALQQLLTFDTGLALVQNAGASMSNALRDSKILADAFAGSPNLATPFPLSDLGQQLQQVARIIQVRAALGVKRQIFFCSLDGFDTHTDQLPQQDQLFAVLSAAMGAFQQATIELGVSNQVTTFTLSDFARTLLPASGNGSDHAWGGHQMIVGGAVQGGNVYGTFPELALSGPDDSSDEGRWIPTTSIDQFGATLASWFGVTDADLPTIFPNLVNFSSPKLQFL